MFTRFKHALTQDHVRRTTLLILVHDELAAWCHLISILAERLTNLWELIPLPPTWQGATDASCTDMDGVFKNLIRQWFFCCSSLSRYTQRKLFSCDNPSGDTAINELDLCAFLAQLLIFKIHGATGTYTQTSIQHEGPWLDSIQEHYHRHQIWTLTSVNLHGCLEMSH